MHPCFKKFSLNQPEPSNVCSISGRMDRASETVDSNLILGLVKSKTRKIGIHSYPAWRSAIKEDNVKPPLCVAASCQLDLETTKVTLLFPGQGNLVNKNVINNKNVIVHFLLNDHDLIILTRPEFSVGIMNMCPVISNQKLTGLW